MNMWKKAWIISSIFLMALLETASIAKTLTISGEKLNVRSGPGRTYDVVEVVNTGEKFEILQAQDGWFQISVEGTLGWVLEKAVTVAADQSIQSLLDTADQYYRKQQFTTPPEANAFDLYRDVLQRDPKNAHAKKRIQQMAAIYKNWSDQASRNGDVEKAHIFYQRYLYIAPADQQPGKSAQKAQSPKSANDSPLKIFRLRSDPAAVTPQEIVPMIQRYGLHHPADWSKYGLAPSITGNIRHEYTVEDISGVRVVTDYAVNLMWQQSGTSEPIPWDQTRDYIGQLNSQQFAGYSDWRLPTIEELASLLETAKKNDTLFLHPLFNANLFWCWSADVVAGSDAAWYVSFSSGGIQELVRTNTAFVLAVRSIQ